MKIKHILIRFLSLLFLFPCTAVLYSCGKEPTPEILYSAQEEPETGVYAQILSFQPILGVYYAEPNKPSLDRSYTHLICRCYTDSGENIWVCVETGEYKEAIDPDFDLYSAAWSSTPSCVIFDSPRNIHGKVSLSDDIHQDLSSDVGDHVFLYSSIDPEKEVSTDNTEEFFSAEITHGTPACMDIVSIAPIAGTGSSGLGMEYEDLLCLCTLADDSTAYMALSVSDYCRYFDSEAVIGPFFDFGSHTISYPEPRQLHGKAYLAGTMPEDFSTYTSDNIFHFISADN